ncbi:MAG: hypothetical protein DWQ01_18955 [Planctomycetota bacterium]|nr:MAG: hypothetical protein DWQ01_18955 [Planctomycetota bacterium]
MLSRFLPLLSFLPFLASAWWPALTPTRALYLAWIVEAGKPDREGPAGGAAGFFLRLALPWLLLHFLRPDAGAGLAAVLLPLAVLTRPWWAGEPLWRRALIPFVLLFPTVLAFAFALGQRPLEAAWQPWEWAAEPSFEQSLDAEELPPPVQLSTLPLQLPTRLEPMAMTDSPRRARAFLLLLLLTVVQIWAAGVGPRRSPMVLLAGLPLVLVALFFGSEPARARVQYQEADGRAWLLQIHPAGGDLFDPTHGPLVPPVGPFVLEAEGQGGLYRMVSPTPWGEALALDTMAEAEGELQAWYEVHLLRAPRHGGPLAESGGLGLLRWWAAGDQLLSGGARWELYGGEEWLLVRRPLP